MYIVISTSLIAVLLAYLSRYKSFSKGLEVGFAIVTFIGCIHYNYGNDYVTYYRMWETIGSISFNSLLDADIHGEPGWRLLNWIFKFKNGFFLLVALLNILQNYIFYRYINDYVPKRWQWLGLFIYLCTTTYYPLFFSMMRQALAMALSVAALMYLYPNKSVENKKIVKNTDYQQSSPSKPSLKRLIGSFLIVLLATTFHVSAIVFVLALIVGYLKLDKLNIFALLILFITVALFFIPGISSTLLSFALDMESLDDYSSYTEVGYETGFGLGFAIRSLPFIVSLYFLLFRNGELQNVEKQLVVISYLAFLTYAFISIATLFDRMGSYFSILHIAVVPILYSKIKIQPIRYLLILLLVFFIFYTYKSMFTSLVWKDTMYEFHSIFEVL